MNKKLFIVSIILFLIDRIIKQIVVAKVGYGQVVTLITNFFYLTRVNNYGAAWSIMDGNRLFLILVGFLSIIFIYDIFIKNSNINKLELISFGMLFGGIIGNLYDRVFLGYVIDYIGIFIGEYKFPIFNIADMLIVLSVILISYTIIKEGEEDGTNYSDKRWRKIRFFFDEKNRL